MACLIFPIIVAPPLFAVVVPTRTGSVNSNPLGLRDRMLERCHESFAPTSYRRRTFQDRIGLASSCGDNVLKSLELFSGCGVFALGLARAGFGHESMIEWNGSAVSTVRHNAARGIEHVRDWNVLHADVRTINWSSFPVGLDLVSGGPPCQPFSIGGKSKGNQDARDMWPYAISAIEAIQPKAFLFENVKGLTRPAFASYLDWITQRLRTAAAGAGSAYEVVVLKVNAADFGAPQKRHRVIVAGLRTDAPMVLRPFEPTHSRERLLWDQWCTGEYWKRHGIARPSDDGIRKVDAAIVQRLRQQALSPSSKPWQTVRDALKGLGEPSGRQNHILQPGAKSYPGHTGSPLDEPAKALKAGNHGVPGGENMMVLDDGSVRYFTVREAARLQGLPDDYEFPGAWSESMRQLGNAVPVDLALSVGKWIAANLGDRLDI
jgi:DNA (cytosine-5)-methyltransferase 1